MDILSAQKKAAEKAKSQQKPEPAPQNEPASVTTGEVLQSNKTEPPVPELLPAAEVVSAPEVEIGPAPPSGSESGETQVEEIELLSFRLGGEEYAVMVENVREVLKLRDLTLVPNTPSYILGVMSLRGQMLSVIDLCTRLCLMSGLRNEKSRIIVVSTDDEDVGLVVDRVTGVFKIRQDAIRPAPENVERGSEYLRGIVRQDDKLYIILDLSKLLDKAR